MDLLDKSIILELMHNCRVSCQDLAKRCNSSRGVVRKRIKALEEIGVIEHFALWYSFAMVDAYFVLGHIKIKKMVEREKLLNMLEQNAMIHAVIPVASGDVVIHAVVVGIDGLSSLGSSIRKIDGVNEADLHLIQYNRGKKVELKKIHLRILAVLFRNSRLSGAEIARRTGLSPRRVRRILNEIITSEGIVFSIARNPARGSGINFYLKIIWDDKITNSQNLKEQFKLLFPEAIWESYISVSSPVLFTRFVVQHIKDVEVISNSASEIEGIKSIEPLVFYPARITSILSRELLKEDILKAGYVLGAP